MLILTGRLPGDEQAPQGAIWDMEPCDKCKEYMSQGVILISVRDGEMERDESRCEREKREFDKLPYAQRHHGFRFMPNPYRTGGWCAVTDETIKKVFSQQMAESVLDWRWAFVEDKAWDALRLPRGNKSNFD